MTYEEIVNYIQDKFKSMKINEYDFYGVDVHQIGDSPNVGDYLYVITTMEDKSNPYDYKGLYIVQPCDCYHDPKITWPNNKINSSCGAHIDGVSLSRSEEICWRNGVWLAEGWHIARKEGLLTKPEPEKVNVSKKCCPLCGSFGDDLVFTFYCSNFGCRNFKP